MHYYFTAVSLIAGICLGFGILSFFIGLRRKDNKPLYFTFALFALCYAVTLFNGIRWYSTTIVTEYITISRFDSIFVTGAFVGLIWYISLYTDFKPRIFLWMLSAAFLVPTCVFIISPATFIGEVSGLSNIILPWGEKLTNLDSSGSAWLDIHLLARLITLGYIILALIRQFRRGEQQPAIILGLGILPFIAGIFYEVLSEGGLLPFIPFGEVGFLGIAIAASLQMASEVIKTEEALEQHRYNLEHLVAERTDDLEKTASALRRSERQTRALLDAPPDTAMLVTIDGEILETNQIAASRLGLVVEESIGKNVFDFFEPELAAVRKAKAEELIKNKQPMQWEDQRDGIFYRNQMYPVLNENDEIESVAVFSTDISARKLAEENLENHIEELRLLNRIASAIVSQTEINAVLESVCELTTSLFQAVSTYVFYVPEEDQNREIYSGYDRRTGFQKARSTPLHPDQVFYAKTVMEKNQATILSDLDSLSIQDDIKKIISESQIQQIMLAPLSAKRKSIGIIAVSSGDDRPAHDQHELEVLETIAGYIAIAIENTRLNQENIEAAAVEERNRLARDLHDAVTQTIYAANLIVESLPQVWARNPEEGQRNLFKLRQLVRGALAEMRSLLFELRPDSLERASIDSLIQFVADAFSGRTNVPVSLEVEGLGDQPSEVKTVFYRITQEIFNNIAKHTEATSVVVNLDINSKQLALSVRDNGLGFDLQANHQTGMGLSIMQERAVEVGAQLKVESQPGEGTRVSLSWSEPELEQL